MPHTESWFNQRLNCWPTRNYELANLLAATLQIKVGSFFSEETESSGLIPFRPSHRKAEDVEFLVGKPCEAQSLVCRLQQTFVVLPFACPNEFYNWHPRKDKATGEKQALIRSLTREVHGL